ncbi:MAG: SAM-dependent methyltransferase, partial [Gammaproteobacteria bacterium]|nr:SAM-dependent methyltransferase [Gammaproteobacteria bacterium]
DQGLDLNWDALAAPGQTRVFYMGLSNAGRIVRELRQRGLPGDTPAALIERGTTAAQRECLTSLDDLEAAIIREGFKPPTLIVVGEVVRLAERLGHQRREIPSDVAAAATFSM